MKPWLLARGQSEEPKQSVSDAPHVVVAVSPPKPPQVSRAQVVPAPMEVSPTHPPILSPTGASRVRRNSAGLETVVSGVSSPANSASSRSSGAGSSSALPVDRKGDIRSPISPARVKALLRSGPALSINAFLEQPNVTSEWLCEHLGRAGIPSFSTLPFPTLSLAAKCKVANYVVFCGFSGFLPSEESVLLSCLCHTNGVDFSLLKANIDSLAVCPVYDFLDVFHALSLPSQAILQHHINDQGKAVCKLFTECGFPLPVKVYCDIDDTLYPNLVDSSFPAGEPYPGVVPLLCSLQFSLAIANRPGESASCASSCTSSTSSATVPDVCPLHGDLVFLTARPKTFRAQNLRMLNKLGLQPSTILSGSFAHLTSLKKTAARKFGNFKQSAKLFPEYRHGFIGDSGQADPVVAATLTRSHALAVDTSRSSSSSRSPKTSSRKALWSDDLPLLRALLKLEANTPSAASSKTVTPTAPLEPPSQLCMESTASSAASPRERSLLSPTRSRVSVKLTPRSSCAASPKPVASPKPTPAKGDRTSAPATPRASKSLKTATSPTIAGNGLVRSRSQGTLTIHTAAGSGSSPRLGVPLDPKRSPRPPRIVTGSAATLPAGLPALSATAELDSIAHTEPPFSLIHDVVAAEAHKTGVSERQQFLAVGVYVFDSYLEAAIVLFEAGILSAAGLKHVFSSGQRVLNTMSFASERQKSARLREWKRAHSVFLAVHSDVLPLIESKSVD